MRARRALAFVAIAWAVGAVAVGRALLLAASLLASALPARRAAQVDPLAVLREEQASGIP